MDALEKKIDDGIRKLDLSIKAMKEESDAKFEELKQLILGTSSSQSTHVDHVPQITKLAAKTALYVPPIRRGYDDIRLEFHNSNAGSSTTIGKNLRPKYLDMEGSNKLDPGTMNDMNGERLKPRTYSGVLFVEAMQPTGFGWEFVMDPCRFLKVKIHMDGYIELNGILKFKDFRNKNNYEQQLYVWKARPYLGIDGVKDELHSIRGMVLKGVFEVPETVMEATFIKGLEPTLRAAVRVMNPEGLNHAMELAVSIEDNQLFEGDMQSKGVAAIVGQTAGKGDNFEG
ncbi:hypothetical protein Tco_0337817 [Tanacetum coccineum]